MNTCLEFRGLEKRYRAVSALMNINLRIEPGEVLALLGPNGAGKSTLFGCLLGLTRPSGGTIFWRGQPLTFKHRPTIGYMPERIALYPHDTVFETGLLFARLRGQDASELERQLKRVGLDVVRERAVRQLSKGMLQRLGLAIALCGQPELLVLDEPFNGLDPALLETLQAILEEEHRRGATILVSTHTISAVESLATRVAVLLEGRLAAHDSIEALRRQHQDLPSLERIYHRIACKSGAALSQEVFA